MQELPAALFESTSLKVIDLHNISVKQLPPTVTLSLVLSSLMLQQTQLTSLPEWMLTDNFASQVRVLAGGTPYCAQLKNQMQSAESAKLMTQVLRSTLHSHI